MSSKTGCLRASNWCLIELEKPNHTGFWLTGSLMCVEWWPKIVWPVQRPPETVDPGIFRYVQLASSAIVLLKILRLSKCLVWKSISEFRYTSCMRLHVIVSCELWSRLIWIEINDKAYENIGFYLSLEFKNLESYIFVESLNVPVNNSHWIAAGMVVLIARTLHSKNSLLTIKRLGCTIQ